MSSFARATMLVPEHDPRPEPFSVQVLDLAIKPRLPALCAWLQHRVPNLTDEVIMECARFGIVEGRGDSFAAVTALKAEVNWPADANLVLIFHEMCMAIPVALRQAERLWQMATGVRFPAEVSDRIEWYSSGRRFTGDVLEIDSSRACAFVQPIMGSLKSGSPNRVLAEMVTQNKSRIYGERMLGFRVEETEDAHSGG